MLCRRYPLGRWSRIAPSATTEEIVDERQFTTHQSTVMLCLRQPRRIESDLTTRSGYHQAGRRRCSIPHVRRLRQDVLQCRSCFRPSRTAAEVSASHLAVLDTQRESLRGQELDYNLLYRWFLDMDLMESSFDTTVVHSRTEA